MESETKLTTEKKHLTKGEIHICQTCEHQEHCKYPAALRSATQIAKMIIPQAWNYKEDDLSGDEIQVDEYSKILARVYVGIRICPRHSSGDPRFTEGLIVG